MDILKIIGDIASILVLIGGIITFFFKESIKAFFARDLLKKQENYKRELETYKTILLKDLEEYKMGIDVRRNLSSEIMSKRVFAYQLTMSMLNHFYGLILRYNSNPGEEGFKLSFGSDEGFNARDIVNKIEENLFYYSRVAYDHFNKLKTTLPIIFNEVEKRKPIDKQVIAQLFSNIKEINNLLLLEVFPDDPTVKEIL